MSLPIFNTKSPTIKRILREASELSSHPDPTLHACPLESDLFEWHFTLAGPPSTPYSEGIYHGRITLPPSYPLRPPSFRFLTPSGRFEVNREICLSISGHHEETWQPAWGIRTALWALRAFMEGSAKGQVGGMEMGKEERLRLATESRRWRCFGCGGKSGEDILKEEAEKVEKEGKKVQGGGGGGEEVPPELRMGFKDEMENGGSRGNSKTPEPSSGAVGDSPSIRSTPITSTTTSVSNPSPPQPQNAATFSSSTSSSSSSSSQIQSPPTSSTTSSTNSSTTTTPPPPALPSPSPPDPMLAWIDKAIAGVVAGLAFMILKKIIF